VQQGQPAFALVSRRKQALDHELLDAMTGGIQKTAADQAGPKAISALEKCGGEFETKIEKLELVCRLPYRYSVLPAARNQMQY
jgi:hypothetical protein